MTNLLLHLAVYLVSFGAIWVGAGMSINAVEAIARKGKVSSFLVSFFVLGVFTSLGELSVGISALTNNTPEIFVGNLLGASIVLCLLIVPILALSKRAVLIPLDFRGLQLVLALAVIGLPIALLFDGALLPLDGALAVGAFLSCAVVMSMAQRPVHQIKKTRGALLSRYVAQDVLKIGLGVAITFFASKYVVQQTLYFSSVVGFSPFLMSLLIIALGTNLPELSLVVRAFFSRSTQVALGDLIGSAVFNTFLLGSLTILYQRPIYVSNSYGVSLFFLLVGLVAFYLFARSKNSLSRVEGAILLCLYTVFLLVEVFIH